MERTEKEKKGQRNERLLKDPYAFTKITLGEKRSGYLESLLAEIEPFLFNLKDPNRDRDLIENTLLIRLEAPTKEFDLKEPP